MATEAVPAVAAVTLDKMEDGDAFDETTGGYLGCITLLPTKEDYLTAHADSSFPVEISVYQGGYWYVYKLDRKEKEETT